MLVYSGVSQHVLEISSNSIKRGEIHRLCHSDMWLAEGQLGSTPIYVIFRMAEFNASGGEPPAISAPKEGLSTTVDRLLGGSPLEVHESDIVRKVFPFGRYRAA